MWLL
jgi:hypothetical protein